ncbi:MAG: TIGR03905 family TSCPD domain-containing protein [Clostridiales bacterium]|nr:TIGR03905 family TSCPD domain-containing protein [Clostridiales bacterium]
MKHFEHVNRGTCSRGVAFDIDDEGRIRNVSFFGGCSGNTQGVAALAEGMDAKEAAARMRGIRCGPRPTSCPDQLARGIEEALAEN